MRVEEVRFLSGRTILAGEWDLPRGDGTFPLALLLKGDGSLHRDGCGPALPHFDLDRRIAEILVESDLAAFRFDRRGSGRSGGVDDPRDDVSPGADALAACARAVRHPAVSRRRFVIVARGTAATLLARNFGLFARILPPRGVVLVAPRLSPEEALALAAPLMVLVPEVEDLPLGPAGALAIARRVRETHGVAAGYRVVHGVDSRMVLTREEMNDRTVPHPDLPLLVRDAIRSFLATPD